VHLLTSYDRRVRHYEVKVREEGRSLTSSSKSPSSDRYLNE
jgi:hypothetical protein